jgi:hypothetical protein
VIFSVVGQIVTFSLCGQNVNWTKRGLDKTWFGQIVTFSTIGQNVNWTKDGRAGSDIVAGMMRKGGKMYAKMMEWIWIFVRTETDPEIGNALVKDEDLNLKYI